VLLRTLCPTTAFALLAAPRTSAGAPSANVALESDLAYLLGQLEHGQRSWCPPALLDLPVERTIEIWALVARLQNTLQPSELLTRFASQVQSSTRLPGSRDSYFWLAVGLVAGALMREKTLDGSEVEALVKTARGGDST
jgi:hypothetical protein